MPCTWRLYLCILFQVLPQLFLPPLICRPRLGAKVLRRTDEFVQRHRGFFDRRGCLALALIVSIPFTGIGCWAGVLLSDLLGLDRRRSACAILIGIAISGFLTTAATYGLLLGVRQLILN